MPPSSETIHSFTATPADAGARLDKVITAHVPELSRSRVQGLLELGCLTWVGPQGEQVVSDPAHKVRAGQMFTLRVPAAEPSKVRAQEIALDIIFEDPHLLIINKAPGMTVHPAPGSPDRTLVNALLAHCGDSLSGIGGVARPGIVHRIDKDTSGLLVVAKHDAAHHSLSDQLLNRSLSRVYRAVVWGAPSPAKGTVTGNIGRHPRNRQKMDVVKVGGKAATTHYTVLEKFGDKAALIECRLETGRTHQIRVHMKHIGHPLVGDQVYGRTKDTVFPRQALHAFQLKLVHPVTGAEMAFEAPLPGDFEKLLEMLRNPQSG